MLSVIMVISFIIWVFSLVSYVVNTFFKNEKTYDNYNVVANYLVESEKELGSLDDMFVGISILICIYGWFFFSTFFLIFFQIFHYLTYTLDSLYFCSLFWVCLQICCEIMVYFIPYFLEVLATPRFYH